jgi:threonine/homoserine/homoserine lactone efflux protein
LSIELYLAFVLAASVLILIPGPNVTNPAVAPMPKFPLLSLTLLVVSLTFDSSYCLLAGRIRPWLLGTAVERLRNKVMGTLLIASGVGLALARRS